MLLGACLYTSNRHQLAALLAATTRWPPHAACNFHQLSVTFKQCCTVCTFVACWQRPWQTPTGFSAASRDMQVVRLRNSASIYRPTCIANLVNAALWVAYGVVS